MAQKLRVNSICSIYLMVWPPALILFAPASQPPPSTTSSIIEFILLFPMGPPHLAKPRICAHAQLPPLPVIGGSTLLIYPPPWPYRCPLLHRSRVYGSLQCWPNVALHPHHCLGPRYSTGGRHNYLWRQQRVHSHGQRPKTHHQNAPYRHQILCFMWLGWMQPYPSWTNRYLVNIADHLSKPLSQILLPQHAAFLLRHVPPKYSPVYQQAITTYCNRFDEAIDRFIPKSYTTPMTAKAAMIHAPTYDDMRGNPWLIILWHD